MKRLAVAVVALVAGGLWWLARVVADAPADGPVCDLCGAVTLEGPCGRPAPVVSLGVGAEVRYPDDPCGPVGTIVERPGYASDWAAKPGQVWVQWPELDYPLPYTRDELEAAR